ncbi:MULTISPECIES: hypothetical protein [Bacillus amyloliquefaciens group]|uniref:hypothetical protein n=1 Tax=Bacillus amyloliquefaciens group TaxID=1938374 RepID=UPI00073C91DE|nr:MULTISPECIES: hypothetical protein [Bacillus amyloliquefaciens group]KTF59768.1 hypothetical protein AR691_13625 [Bacillus amyloliquefaciens]
MGEVKVKKDEELFQLLVSMYEILGKINKIIDGVGEKVQEKNDELNDLDHILELKELTDDQMLAVVKERKEVRKRRRVVKNIKHMVNLLGDKNIDLDGVYKGIGEKLIELEKTVCEDSRCYNMRTDRITKKFTEITNKYIHDRRISTGLPLEGMPDKPDKLSWVESPEMLTKTLAGVTKQRKTPLTGIDFENKIKMVVN